MRRILHHIVLSCVLLVLVAPAHAQPSASASLRADPVEMFVGDQSRVFLSAQSDPSLERIVWPPVPDSFGKLEVVEKGKIDTVKNGLLTVYTQRLLVSGWDSAAYTIPPFQFSVIPANGQGYNIRTEALTLNVSTVPVDTTKPFKPIKGIMEVESSWLDYLWWYIGAALLLIAIGAFAWWQKTRKKPEPVMVPPPLEPVHEKALRKLRELESEGVWQRGEVKEYYVRLTDILRIYLEERYQIPAMERTTDELSAVAGSHLELAFHARNLHGILATADMAKFARAQPIAAEHIAAMQSTRELILATIPRPLSTPEINPNDKENTAQ